MHSTFSLHLAAAALVLVACSHEAPKQEAPAAAKPAAPAAQETPKPAPAPKPEPAPAPTPAPTPEPAPAAPAAPATPTPPTAPAATTEGSMYGPQNLLDAKNPKVNEKAPDTFKAKFETNEGAFVIEVTRAWAPIGADRFYNLVRNGFFDEVRFFRVLPNFMAQFGVNGDPKISAAWRGATLQDEPVTQKNTRGMVTFAKTAAPNTRTTQLFINFGDNSGSLDPQGFSPFGQVVEGMEVVDKLYTGYGEGAPRGNGPEQGRLGAEGNAYLTKSFPELDYIVKATIVP